jgi:hypothetical protein
MSELKELDILNDKHTNTNNNIQNIFSTQQLMLMMLPIMLSTITQIITRLFNALIKSQLLSNFIELLTPFFNRTLGVKSPSEYIIIQRTRQSTTSALNIDSDQKYNGILIISVIEFLSKLNLTISCGNVNHAQSDDLTISSENLRLKARKYHFIPKTYYEYDNMQIKYSKTESESNNGEKDTSSKNNGATNSNINYKLHITSHTRTFQQIHDFVHKCYCEHIDTINPVADKECRKMFYQIKSEDDSVALFKMYKYGTCEPENAFKGIFIPKKIMKQLRSQLDKFKRGEINKFIVLFTGVPGCGKTTVQRAIIEYLDRSFIMQKLSHNKNDDALMDLYLSPKINTDDGCIITVPLNERIYVLEDADTDSKIMLCRKKAISENNIENVPISRNNKIEIKLENKSESTDNHATTGGFLNALDGIKRLDNFAMLISTNHPELLDEAVIRYGRITLKINLVKMTAEDAQDMISYHFNGKNVKDDLLKPDVIIPCDLEALCKISENIEELESGLLELYTIYENKLIAKSSNC